MDKPILQAHELFKTAGFDYAVCGGFALDMFAGKELRSHGDFDILVFKEDRRRAVQFMIDNGWRVFGRFMEEGRLVTQHLFYEINDITDSFWDGCKNMWAVKPDCLPNVLERLERLRASTSSDIYTYKPRQWLVQEDLEFIELEVDMKDGTEYVARENPRITRTLDKAILYREGIPYLAPEIILFYKSDKFSSENSYAKPRTESDFKAVMPMLCKESKEWLQNALDAAYPDGYEWLGQLL